MPARIKIEQVDGAPQFTLIVDRISFALQQRDIGVPGYYRTDFGATLDVRVPIAITVREDNKLDVVPKEELSLALVNFTISDTLYEPDSDPVVAFLTAQVNRQIKDAVSILVSELQAPLEGITRV